MNEHRITLFVEEYRLLIQEPELPRRAETLGLWFKRSVEECTADEHREVLKRILRPSRTLLNSTMH